MMKIDEDAFRLVCSVYKSEASRVCIEICFVFDEDGVGEIVCIFLASEASNRNLKPAGSMSKIESHLVCAQQVRHASDLWTADEA